MPLLRLGKEKYRTFLRKFLDRHPNPQDFDPKRKRCVILIRGTKCINYMLFIYVFHEFLVGLCMNAYLIQ